MTTETSINFENIPEELKARKQWVCSRMPSKVPCMPSGTAASSTDPGTWSTFDACRDVAVKRGWGIAFIFTATDPYAVIDLDHVRNANTGETEPWALTIIDNLKSYFEVSWSGTGWHIIVEGKLPGQGNKRGRVEMYDQKKPMTLTGNTAFGFGTEDIAVRDLGELQRRLGELDPAAARPTPVTPTTGDASAADFGLACRLARQFECDEAKVREEFLKQAAPRQKLRRTDYVNSTVKNAIARVTISKPLVSTTTVDKPALPIVEEPEIRAEDDPLPEFPKLPGALGQLVDGITHDLPYEHKALAAITYLGIELAGNVRLVPDLWLEPRFYSCLVASASGGKSAAEFEVRRALKENDVLKDVYVELSIDSGPALVQALEENRRLILAPDELADQFEKARAGATGRNSLFGELLRLFESNETGNHTKKTKDGGGKIELHDARFALIGGTTTERFSRMFLGTGAVASGLQSRFVLSYSEKIMPRLKTQNDGKALNEACQILAGAATKEGRKFRLSEAAQDAIREWRPFEDDGADKMKRVLDMAKRFALVVAACQQGTEIDEPTMRLALQFADYQIALRERLFPMDAATHVQAFENRILNFFEKHERSTEAVMQNYIKPEKLQGGFAAYNRAWAELRRAGKVIAAGQTRNKTVVFVPRT